MAAVEVVGENGRTIIRVPAGGFVVDIVVYIVLPVRGGGLRSRSSANRSPRTGPGVNLNHLLEI